MPDIMATIRARMAERHVTQQQVADALGIGQPQVSDYLSNRPNSRLPGVAKLNAWLDFLGLEVKTTCECGEMGVDTPKIVTSLNSRNSGSTP